MTSSAIDRVADSDRLTRTLDLYRDLTVALRDRITLLRTGTGENTDGKALAGIVRDHQRALQTVLDIEASLGKRSKASAGGMELDLPAARAEIVARLAVWAAAG
jgi:hypothetical protein